MPTLPSIMELAEATCGYLTSEKALLQSIVEHAGELKGALIARDLPKLEQLTKRLQHDHEQRTRLSPQRQQLQLAMSHVLQLPLQEATVSKLVAAVPAPTKHKLEQERAQLVELAQQANQINRCNLSLAARFAQLAQQLLESLTGQAAVPCYGKSGQLDGNVAPALFQRNF